MHEKREKNTFLKQNYNALLYKHKITESVGVQLLLDL